MDQEAMEPEAVAAGLVAGDHLRARGQVEPLLGLLDLEGEADEAAGGERAKARLLAGLPAASERRRGFWPAPMVKASFQELRPSSKAR
jgi:hypothetical protein